MCAMDVARYVDTGRHGLMRAAKGCELVLFGVGAVGCSELCGALRRLTGVFGGWLVEDIGWVVARSSEALFCFLELVSFLLMV